MKDKKSQMNLFIDVNTSSQMRENYNTQSNIRLETYLVSKTQM